jgi:hypothetical protein
MTLDEEVEQNIRLVVEQLRKCNEAIRQLYVFKDGRIIGLPGAGLKAYQALTFHLTVSSPPEPQLQRILKWLIRDLPNVKAELENQYYNIVRDSIRIARISDEQELGELLETLDVNIRRLDDDLCYYAKMVKEAIEQRKRTGTDKGQQPAEASGGSESDNIQETSETIKLNVEAIRVQVFICYSHKDERWLSDLQKHLKPYLRDGSITAWSDRQITLGSKWFPEIEKALALTKVAVLLVTPDFLASDFIHEKELGPLLKEAEKGEVRILWIPVRACSYKKTPLKDYQAVIDPDKPLVNFRLNRDKIWVRICEEIEKAVKS